MRDSVNEKNSIRNQSFSDALEGDERINDLDHVLALVQVHGGEHVLLSHSNLHDGIEALSDELHLLKRQTRGLGGHLDRAGLDGVAKLWWQTVKEEMSICRQKSRDSAAHLGEHHSVVELLLELARGNVGSSLGCRRD